MAEACGYRDHSESINAIDSARKQKPYQKIQGTTDPAVEEYRFCFADRIAINASSVSS
jgi:hypothetical protein